MTTTVKRFQIRLIDRINTAPARGAAAGLSQPHQKYSGAIVGLDVEQTDGNLEGYTSGVYGVETSRPGYPMTDRYKYLRPAVSSTFDNGSKLFTSLPIFESGGKT